MRHHLRLRVLLPAIASLVAACGGSTEPIADATSSSGGSSSGNTTSSGGTTSSSSGNTSSSGATSSSSSSGTVETFATNVCTASKGYEPMVGLTLTGVDSLELRNQTDVAGTADPPPVYSMGIAGTVCATATNKSKCESDVTAFRSDKGWNATQFFGGPVQAQHRYGVTTKGDTIDAITEVASLKKVLVPIENAKDAALLVTASGENYFTCDGNNAIQTATGFDIKVHSGTACGAGNNELERVYAVTTDGTVTKKTEIIFQQGTSGCAVGRRPDGLVAYEGGECADPVGRFFAEVAHLEAASVYSFERLAGELLDLDAPDELVAAAYSSREDEIRHARMTAKMAKRFGGRAASPQVEELPARSKLAIAIENATEGCVRETYGALVAHRQATDASDASIRCMMQVIADDETKHAGLAWDVAAWLEPQLTTDERELVNDARRRALADLRRELAADVHPDLRTRAGMPDAVTALAMLDALDQRFIASA